MAGQQLSDHDLLVRIDTKLDGALDTQRDHETRLRRVERVLWVGMGIAAMSGTTIGTIVSRAAG